MYLGNDQLWRSALDIRRRRPASSGPMRLWEQILPNTQTRADAIVPPNRLLLVCIFIAAFILTITKILIKKKKREKKARRTINSVTLVAAG